MSKTLVEDDILNKLQRDANDNLSVMRIVKMCIIAVITMVLFFTIALPITNAVLANWMYGQKIEQALDHFDSDISADEYVKILEVIEDR